MQMIYSRGANGKKVDRRSAFTLVELLVVLAIVVILGALSFKSFSGILSGGFNQVVSDMSQALAQARAYAMANNTYVYVGFDEVNAADTSTTPATGTGLVVVAIAASADGTNGFDPSATTWSPYNSTTQSASTYNLVAISKLMKFPNVHLPLGSTWPTTGIPSPGSTGSLGTRPAPSSPNYFLNLTANPSTAGKGFSWPVGFSPGTVNYNFSNLIRFGPQGDATILALTSGTPTVTTVDYIEIGVEPSHGNTVGTTPTNVCALQIDGSTGLVKTYRP